jgi:hypothetical protein
MSLTIRLEREKPREGTVQVEKGSVRAPDRQVVTLKVRVTNDSNTTEVWVELNAIEAETLANALKAGVK